LPRDLEGGLAENRSDAGSSLRGIFQPRGDGKFKSNRSFGPGEIYLTRMFAGGGKEKRRRPEVRAISNTDGPESMAGVKGRSIT
jgi:hypothetical protein